MKKKKNRKKRSPGEWVNMERRRRWADMVSKGLVTKQQAHTLATVEYFLEGLYVFQFIDYPSDKAAIRRVRTFLDLMTESVADKPTADEPSFLMDDDEGMIFCVAGLRCGMENSTEKNTLSGALITEKRLFLFDSVEDPHGYRLRNGEVSDPDHAVSVHQFPLKNIRRIEVHAPTPLFPHGSFEISFQFAEYFVRACRHTLDLVVRNAEKTGTQQTWIDQKKNFTGFASYEMELRSEEANAALRTMYPLLMEIGRNSGFEVIPL